MDDITTEGLLNGAQDNGQAGAANQAEGAGAAGNVPTGDAGQAGVNQPQAIEYQPFSLPDNLGNLADSDQQQVAALAQEMGLTQAQAQKWVGVGAKVFTDGMEAVRLEVKKKFDEWENASKSDPEISPFLQNGKLPKVSELINRAMGPEDGKAFHTMASETGIGANPLFIKFCLRMSALMGEAPFVGGSAGGQRAPSVEQQASLLFPGM